MALTEEDQKDRSKTITIIVNAEEKTIDKKDELTFDEAIDLAFNPRPTGDQIIWRITYFRGHGDKPEGRLLPGGSVKPKEGMVFSVKYTDKS